MAAILPQHFSLSDRTVAESIIIKQLSQQPLVSFGFRRCKQNSQCDKGVTRFLCRQLNLMVEFCHHHELANAAACFERDGQQVLRFGFQAVLTDVSTVTDALVVVCRQRQHQLSMSQMVQRYIQRPPADPVTFAGSARALLGLFTTPFRKARCKITLKVSRMLSRKIRPTLHRVWRGIMPTDH